MDLVSRKAPAAALGLALILTSLGFGGATAATAAPAAAAAPADRAAPVGIGYWFLAPSLVKLQREVNARWPNRSRASDGTIGDSAHRRSPSDHNPVGHRNGPGYGTPGAVHGMDITANGINTSVVLNSVIGDRRVAYVIHNGRIWSARYGWAPRTYWGSPHQTHIHISLRGGSASVALAAERDTGRWLSETSGRTASVKHSPKAKRYAPGARGRHIAKLQRRLIRWGFPISSGATGYFGPQTRRAVKKFQVVSGWRRGKADGVPGKPTLRRIGLA